MASQPPATILFVHHRSELGGAPGSLAALIESLDRSRFQPHVYCPPGPAAERFRRAGAQVHEGPVSGFTHIWASSYHGRRWLFLGAELVRLPAHLLAFRRLLAERRYDLVHLNDSPLLAAGLLAHRRGIPVVWHLRSAPAGGGVDRRSRTIRRLISRSSNAVIAINRDVADLWRLEAEIVPDPIPLDLFVPGDTTEARRELGLDEVGPVIGYVGFLYPAKGYAVLVQAAGLLQERGNRACYLFAGGGVRPPRFFGSVLGRLASRLGLARDHASEARRLARELGLEASTRLLGYIERVELVYQASDLIVAPSQGPELGLSMLEAAASGVPGIATGSRSGAGVLDETTTLYVERAGPGPLADAIAELLADPERRERMGRAGRALAEKHLDRRRVVRQVEQIYLRILAPALEEHTAVW